MASRYDKAARLKLRQNMVDDDELRAKGKVEPKTFALIACPWTFSHEVEFQSQQLGLGYVGAYAVESGHELIAFIDPMVGDGKYHRVPLKTRHQETNRFGYSDAWIVEQIPPDVEYIGINAPFTDSRLVLYPLVRKIKAAFPKIPVIVGGVLATTLPRQVIEESGADIVVMGEGEIAFSWILGGRPLEEIPGLVFRLDDGSIFENPKRALQIRRIDDFPLPGYNFRPMAEYVKWSPRGDRVRRTLCIISSRGCPFMCDFCSIPEKGQIWRAFSPERILDEIKMAIELWGVNHIEFEDDNFTLEEERALVVLRYLADLRSKGCDITCSFPNGVMIDKLSLDLVRALKAAGADIVYLPVEAGDPRVLMSMDKPAAEGHLAKTLEVARWCVEVGLPVSSFFIVGYPGGRLSPRLTGVIKRSGQWEEFERDGHLLEKDGNIFLRGEDQKAFETTLDYAKRLREIGVERVTPLIATPYPGTDLYDFCEEFGFLAYPDDPLVLTTVSYGSQDDASAIQIETPWCSQEETFERWKTMMDVFETVHNVRREEGGDLLSGDEIRRRTI